jgi:hypothetical protein
MLSGALLCLLSAGSCNYQPLEALALSTVASSYLCGRIQFTITSPTTVTPNWPDRPCSGNPPLAILSAPSMAWSQANNRTLTMPLRIINRGTIPVQLPIRMILPLGGKTVLLPTETPSSKMVPQNQDSTRTDGTTVWLVGGTGTLGAGDSTSVRTILFRIDAPVTKGQFAFTINGETANGVPAVAPDSEPAWFAIDSNRTASGVMKRVLDLRFLAGATPEQKQAAVDSVGGIVVGGYHLSNDPVGVYIIHMPTVTTDSGLLARRLVLRRQPGVEWAHFVGGGKPSGLRPNDGSGWQSKDWDFRRDSSKNENWAFEEVNLPLAWGCQTGMSSPGIALIESRLSPSGEFVVNARSYVASPTPLNTTQTSHREHGKWVASILTAQGNNSAGGAGVLWAAQVDPFALHRDTSTRTLRIDVAIDSLMRRGDSIILITAHPDRDTSIARDTSLARDWSEEVVFGMTVGGRTPPLLIATAGNDNRDVALTAYGRAAILLPNKIIIVGATEPRVGVQRNRWGGPGTGEHLNSGSNHGSLVDIYAPGKDVGVYDLDSARTIYITGTSFAAPLVTGIAGLLKAFDNRLTADAIRTFILQGATAGGLQVGNTGTGGVMYLANAYESLKLAARTTHAPLCGNRVWANGFTIYADRGGVSEELFTPSDLLSYVKAYHGGRRIDYVGFENGPGAIQQTWTGTLSQWVTASGPPPSALPSGAFLSSVNVSHDADSVATVQGGVVNNLRTFAIHIQTSTSDSTLGTFTRPVPAATGGLVCVQQDARFTTVNGSIVLDGWDCTREVWNGDQDGLGSVIAYSPMGDQLVLAIPHTRTSTSSSSPVAACPWATIHNGVATPQCSASITTHFQSLESEIVSVSIVTNPVVRSLTTVSSREVFDLTISEAGQEVGATIGVQDFTSTETPGPSYWVTSTSSGGFSSCGRRYWTFNAGSTALQSPVDISASEACEFYGGGTFSAARRRTDRPIAIP